MPAIFKRESDGFEYPITRDDVVWLARSLWGEAGASCDRVHASLVSWTMMNRFLLPRPQKKLLLWSSFTKLIRDFSQPTNSKWTDKGAFCRPGGKFYGKPECSKQKVERRNKIQGAPWDTIPRLPRMYADEFWSGDLEQIYEDECFVDFASTKMAKQYGTDVGVGNFFFTREQSKKAGLLAAWLPGAVTVYKPD